VTLETRRRLYQRAEAEQWLLVFEHDPTVVSGRLRKEGKGVGLVEGYGAPLTLRPQYGKRAKCPTRNASR